MGDGDKNKAILGQVIAKAWEDDGYRQKLVSKPGETLKSEGIDVPESIKMIVREESENTRFIVLSKDLDADHPNKQKLYEVLEHYFPIAEGQQVCVVQDSETVRNIVIPCPPIDEVGELRKLAGGAGTQSQSAVVVTETTASPSAQTEVMICCQCGVQVVAEVSTTLF